MPGSNIITFVRVIVVEVLGSDKAEDIVDGLSEHVLTSGEYFVSGIRRT